MNQIPGGQDERGPAPLLQSLKRQTVAAACQNCRSKKVKCDGQIPCGYCSRRAWDCIYETHPDETQQQARKRKHEELVHREHDYERLYQTLAGKDEAFATSVFARIRGGERLHSLFDFLQHGSPQDGLVPGHEPDDHLRRLFLFALIQSTAPLHEVAGVASSFLRDRSIILPPSSSYKHFCDKVITLEKLGFLLSDTDAGAKAGVESSNVRRMLQEHERPPPTWVPAAPWLAGTSDWMVSHLVSLFFAYLNQSWRYVEQDLFLKGMRSQNLNAEYCSPLLVNAMLALAALYSDIGDEDRRPENLPERGIEYHQAAIRLWDLEEGRPSVTNVQALMILAVECLVRGKDVQGFTLLSSASTLNSLLPVPEMHDQMSKDELEYLQVRGNTWWMAVHVDLTYKLGLLMGPDSTNWEQAPFLDDLFPDNVTYWVGYPLTEVPIPFRANLLLRQRCRFTRYLWEAVKILIWDAGKLDGRQLHAEVVSVLSARMETWYRNLPRELVMLENMPPGVYDLHIQYHCVQMALHERTYIQMFGLMSNRSGDTALKPEDELLRSDLRAKTLDFCYLGATIIRRFRETYGLKLLSLISLNHSVLGVFITLNDLHAHPKAPQSGTQDFLGPVRDTQSALEEFFHVLLATSLRWTISRGVARIAYHTAATLDVELPECVVQVLGNVATTAWQSADLQQLDTTTYPNWSLPHVQKSQAEDNRMGDMLRQWEAEGTHRPRLMGLMKSGPREDRGGHREGGQM